MGLTSRRALSCLRVSESEKPILIESVKFTLSLLTIKRGPWI